MEDMLFLHKVQKQAKLGHDVKVKVVATLESVYKELGHKEVLSLRNVLLLNMSTV